MHQRDLTFVIPTYRLREVGQTVEEYDHHFWKNGHSARIVVFDDSTLANQEKYFSLLEQTHTHSEIHYVGPREKEAYLAFLHGRLRDTRLEGLVKNLFRPSYGGNRNCAMMYTLGDLVVSADDDMRPFALMEEVRESLYTDEVCRGRLEKAGAKHVIHKSFDILAAFDDVLGKAVSELPENYERGEVLLDTAMDLETNATKGLSQENSLVLEHGIVPPTAKVKIAQTFRSGTNDIDAIDFVDLFLSNDDQVDPDSMNDVYTLVNFRPVVTNRNWRLDCGVAGYDNTFGLPPFFPTRLRFEDYIHRLWLQREGVAAAHVDAAQHHVRSSYMRNPPAAEVFNEEVANLIKGKIKSTVTRLHDLGVEFDYGGEVSAGDAQMILDKMAALHLRTETAASKAVAPDRTRALRQFAATLNKAFYGFEPDFCQQNLARIVDDVVSVIKGSMELWPSLVEITYFQKMRNGLPFLRVHNHRLGSDADHARAPHD